MCESTAPSAPTNQNITQTSIPDYAKPYAESMLGKGFGSFNPATGVMEGGVYSQPYQAYGGEKVANFSDLQKQAQTGIAGLQTPGGFGQAATMAGQAGQGVLGTVDQAGTYGAQGSTAGRAYGQNATDANAVQQYMNPYLRATLDPALQLQNQQFGMLDAQNQGRATQAGAFGGGRQAIMQGLNQQNQMLAQNQLTGNAYNQAYSAANQNMQEAGRQGMAGAGLGLQGIAAQQAGFAQAGNQATNLSNITNQGLGAQQGIYGLQNQVGAQQQAQQQAIDTSKYNDFLAQRAYPIEQLANQSNMLRGLPMAGSGSSTQYLAPPSAIQNLASLGLGAAGISKVMAKGGMAYSNGGGLGAIALNNLV